MQIIAEIIILSGSIPAGFDSDIYCKLCRIGKNAGAKVIIDADGEAFSHGLIAVPYCLKPNLHELENYCGRKLDNLEDIKSALLLIISYGVQLAIVSLGEK